MGTHAASARHGGANVARVGTGDVRRAVGQVMNGSEFQKIYRAIRALSLRIAVLEAWANRQKEDNPYPNECDEDAAREREEDL